MKTMKYCIMFCSVLLSFGCSSNVRYYPYLFHAEPARNIKTVIISPLNLVSPRPRQLGNQGNAVYDAVKTYLAANRISVKSSDTVKSVWEEEQQKIGGLFSPVDGNLISGKFAKCLKNTVTRVCNAQSVDALVFPEIVVRQATLDRLYVYWDGAQQPVALGKNTAEPNIADLSGNSNALSLKIVIIYKDGQVVLRNIAGLEHPYRIVRKEGTNSWASKLELREDLFTDEAKLKWAVAVGFHPFILYPEYPVDPVFSEHY